jgi:hypothetical protein
MNYIIFIRTPMIKILNPPLVDTYVSKNMKKQIVNKTRLVALDKVYCSSHQMFRHMHRLLNIDYLRNQKHS